MNPLLTILIGGSFGMFLVILVQSVRIQISEKYTLNFLDAFKLYTTKYIGPIVVGLLVIFIAMFVFPDIVANFNTEVEHSKTLTRIIKWLRSYSVFLGVVSQGLGFLIVGRGEKYLRMLEQEKVEKTRV